ncbi:MAG: Fur family transcriptional regulator [bacterium]|jgi:Fur family ferric uptake transcriptional regulator
MQRATGITIIEPMCAVFRRHLRAVGLKYTPERARVLDTALGMHGPFLVDDLLAKLDGGLPRVSKATTYRTIKLLEASGIVQKLLLTSTQSHYQLAFGNPSSAILVRTDANAVEQVQAQGLDALVRTLAAARGLHTQGYRLVVYASAEPGVTG